MPIISSRTPEGVPNRCPICEASVCIEPSHTPGDGPCPRCDRRLWFSPTSNGVMCYDYQLVAPFRDRVCDYISARLGINHYAVRNKPSHLSDLGADSLEIVELIMDLEEEFEVTTADEDAEKIITVRDRLDDLFRHAVDYLFRQLHP